MRTRSRTDASALVALAALALAALASSGCAGAIEGSISASVRAGINEHFTSTERCRELTRPSTSGGASLAMAAPRWAWGVLR